ncbi:MAG: MFS transporter [Myxococcota bacterium]
MQPAAAPREEAPSSEGLLASLEAERVTPYLGFLFLLLSTATLFDGFDAATVSFAGPDVCKSLGISDAQWGPLIGLTRLGVMASFFFVFFADTFGRRRMMMFTIVGFTVANFATGLVTTKTQFVLVQLVARLFLTAEFSLAIIMVGEEFPARIRGFSIAVLTSLGTVGVMLMSKLQPYVLAPAGDGPHALRDTGRWLISTAQSVFGQESAVENWRGLYALGMLPLALIFVLRLAMRETRRFEAVQVSQRAAPKRTLRELIAEATVPWRPEYRRRTATVALLWNCVYLVTAPSTVYWVLFARRSLQLDPYQIGDIVFWGYLGGVAGSFVGGSLIDRIGRKRTCAGAYTLGAVAIFWLYHVTQLPAMYFWMIATVFAFGAGNSATHVYASELFPTEIRATGYGWTSNLAGRVTDIAVPIGIGFLIPSLGIPGAIALVAIGPILGAILVLRYAPETRGMTLEQIQTRLRA